MNQVRVTTGSFFWARGLTQNGVRYYSLVGAFGTPGYIDLFIADQT
jgi:hypothetical protein